MKTIEVLRRLNNQTKCEVFITGGYVRDLLRNKRNSDLDIVIRNLSLNRIIKFLKRYGKVKEVTLSKTNDRFSVSLLLFKTNGEEYAQIKLPTRGKKQIADSRNTLQQDSKHRDFTINAMYLPINFKSKKDVIDIVGGRQDIRNRQIRSVGDPDRRIMESPIRIMRALSIAARTGYTIDNRLTAAMNHHYELLQSVPIDNIRMELNKILLSKRPSKYFKLMENLGILRIVIPELSECNGVHQDKRYHKFDVFRHCIYTCDHIEPDLVLRLSAILHDIGKPRTKGVNSDRVTFHKHEIVGVKMAKTLLSRLGYSNDIRRKVLKLIRLHMYHYTREFSDAAVRRFIKKSGIDDTNIDNLNAFPLFKLRAAERLGNGLKTIPITEKQIDFQNRIVKIYKSSNALDMGDLNIDGNKIMSVFNLKPSTIIGEIKKYLLDAVLEDNTKNNEKDLIKLAAEYIYLSQHGE